MKPLPRSIPDATEVWRYLPLGRLLTAIKTRQLPLTILASYSKDDPYETSVPDVVVQSDCQIIYQDIASHFDDLAMWPFEYVNNDHERYSKLKARRRALLRSAHASCWRWGEDESEAMWRIYDPCGSKVAIRSTFEKLQASIEDACTVVSEVAYIDYKARNFLRYEHEYDPALHKRNAFLHEQEVRVLRFSEDDFKRAGADEAHRAPDHVYIDWDPEMVVDRIVLNPRCADWSLEMVTGAIEKLSATLAKAVRSSDLAEPPGW